MHVEWHREEPTPSAGTGDDLLAAELREEIAATGPMTFERFMRLALYGDRGYYTTSVARPTRAGDFLTAPELHPIFGRTLARQIDEMWRRLDRPDDFAIQEWGAGTGALFLAIVEGLLGMDSPVAATVRYEPIDFAPQRALIQERLTEAGLEDRLVPISEREQPRTGVILANEYLDALPVNRVIQLDGSLREIFVDWRDDAFVEVAGPVSDDRLKTWFDEAGVTLSESQRAEVNIAMLEWVARLSRQLERGYVLVVDYGAPARELYDTERRPNGTIRAFAGQRVSSDVLSAPGGRDITSHLDFDALERQARACGFELAGRRRSNEFLLACGLDDAYAQARADVAEDWDAALNLRSAVQRLLDPNALGGYLVTVLAKGVPPDPPLRGFAPLSPKK